MTSEVKTAIHYYSVSFLLYFLEIGLISLAITYLPYNSLILNFFIRVIACLVGLFIYKNYVLIGVEKLYLKYVLLVALTPFISSMLIFSISTITQMEFMIIKIGSDVVLSIFGYFVLRKKQIPNE